MITLTIRRALLLALAAAVCGAPGASAQEKIRIGYWTSGFSVGFGAVLEAGKFVEQQGLWMTKQSLRQQHANLLPTLQIAHFALMQLFRDVEPMEEDGSKGTRVRWPASWRSLRGPSFISLWANSSRRTRAAMESWLYLACS